MEAKNKKRLWIGTIVIGIFLIAVAMLFLRNLVPSLFLNVDIYLNCEKTHDIWAYPEEYHLSLPPRTTKISQESDTCIFYYSKYSGEEFLEYYEECGYRVEGNTVYTDIAAYLIEEDMTLMREYKYHFVLVDMLVEPEEMPEVKNR